MQPSTMHRWFKRCLLIAGAADFPMHELRHTAGNEFRRATGDLELIRLFMRHASISTTSEHYMHADREELVAGHAARRRALAQRVTSGIPRKLREEEARSGFEPL